jgi:hypothetical protein
MAFLTISEAVTAYTHGHSRTRLSWKSDVNGVPAVHARARACSPSCTRLVPAARCLFLKQATESLHPTDHDTRDAWAAIVT